MAFFISSAAPVFPLEHPFQQPRILFHYGTLDFRVGGPRYSPEEESENPDVADASPHKRHPSAVRPATALVAIHMLLLFLCLSVSSLLRARLPRFCTTKTTQRHTLDGNSREIGQVEPDVRVICATIACLPADKRMDNTGEEEKQEVSDRVGNAFAVPEPSRQKVDQQLCVV